jgi:uncharacterized protein YijF (DUF1287 family)
MHIVNRSVPNLQSWFSEADNELSVEDMGKTEVENELLAKTVVVADM